jgi:methionyl-tRNA formyltransferase
VIKVLGAEVVDDSAGLGHREYPAGTVVSGPGPNIGVVSGKGVLEITWLQMEGKRAMSAGEFLRGHPELPGSTLPS